MWYSQTKYYILCVSNLRSGGPEALHQLRYYMEKAGLDAYIVYYNMKEGVEPMPEPYDIYGIKRKRIEEIEDAETNTIISAESSTIELNRFRYIRKYIWWLSVNWLDYKPLTFDVLIKHRLRQILLKDSSVSSYCNFSLDSCTHVCGSKYAFEYVKTLGLKASYLVEPISKTFLETDNHTDFERNDIVLYNPAKPSEIMNKLLSVKRFKFKALTGMTTTELVEAYKMAKLYIDFGHFGGPERMPKEAVYFGCCILVGKRNAAENDFDIAIPDKYKIENYNNVEVVKAAINSVIDKYLDCMPDFIPFKNKIEKLESEFIHQISNLFCR